MALPILGLIGAALAGGAGIFFGVSAMDDFDEAERSNEEAEQTFKRAKKSLQRQRRATQEGLKDLGRQKVHLHENGLKPFVAALSRIKNVDYTGMTLGEDSQVTKVETRDIQRTVTKMEKLVGPGAAALGAGALTGLATYGSVGVLGTASTGTAIAGLSGAAAKSATLAWLGGGSLAAGGAGMAGGAAVLGGIAFAPVLLVGGLVMQSKAKDALNDAESNLKEAEFAAEAMKTAGVACRRIRQRAKEVWQVLNTLQCDHLDDALPKLERLVSANADYSSYNDDQKHLVMHTAAVAKTAHLVSETPLFDEDGVVTKEIRRALKKANSFLRAISTI